MFKAQALNVDDLPINLHKLRLHIASNITLLPSGCWRWGRSKTKGYVPIRLDLKKYGLHRLSYALYKGPIPENTLVCHSCDNMWCINPDHLWLGTHKDNSEDMVEKGRSYKGYHGKGFRTGHALSKGKRVKKLTDDQVREIRATLGNGEMLKDIAARYGVSVVAVSVIRRGLRKQLVD